MNMNTAESMGGNGALGRRKKRRIRDAIYQITNSSYANKNLFSYYLKAMALRIYKCFLL